MTSSNPGTASSPVDTYVYDTNVTTSSPSLPSDIYLIEGGTLYLQGSARYQGTRKEYTLEFSMSSSEGTLGLYTEIDGDTLTVEGTINASGTALVTALWRDVAFNRNVTQTITVHGGTNYDYGGTQTKPLQSLSLTCGDVHSHGTGTAYIFAGSPVTISAMAPYTVTSVTPDRGLTISQYGDLSGNLFGVSDVEIVVDTSFTLTLHVVSAYRICLSGNPLVGTKYTGTISLTDDPTTVASFDYQGTSSTPIACMIQVPTLGGNTIGVDVKCDYNMPKPTSLSTYTPWIIRCWWPYRYNNDAWTGYRAGRLYELPPPDIYHNFTSLTFSEADFTESPSGSGIKGVTIVPVMQTTGVYRICFDGSAYDIPYIDDYIYPGVVVADDPNRTFELNTLSAPLQGQYNLGPTTNPVATFEIINWNRVQIHVGDTTDTYSEYAPEEYETIYAANIGTTTRNTLLYKPLAHFTNVNEDQDAILIFDNGGGEFVPNMSGGYPTVYRDGDPTITFGTFFFDDNGNRWVWCSGKGALGVGTETTIILKSLPHTPIFNGQVMDSYSLLPPSGMSAIDSWDTETPYFQGKDQSETAGDCISFRYTLTARKSQDMMIRRTFYPTWLPVKNEGDGQRAILVTPGHKTIEINDIQSVTETYSVALDTKPIVVYGYKRNFCMDLGVSKTISLNYIRPGLPYPDDPANPTLQECDDNSGDSRRWSNAKWIEAMQELLNRWQMRTNGSEFYLLRPGRGRNSETYYDDDPMKSYNTRIIRENCYISNFPIPYAEMPHAISGSLNLTMGTLYPKKEAQPLVTVNYYQPMYYSGNAPPGSLNNPYPSYTYYMNEWNWGNIPTDIYVALGGTVQIQGTITQYGSHVTVYDAVFANSSAEHYGLSESNRETTISFTIFPSYSVTYNVHSISGTIGDASGSSSVNVAIKIRSSSGSSSASEYTITVHGIPLPSGPSDTVQYFNAASRRYPATSLFMLPEPTTVFGGSQIQFITTESGGSYDYSISGTAVSGWRRYNETPEVDGAIPPKTVVKVSSFWNPSSESYEVYGVGTNMEGAAYHFFFPDNDPHNNARRKYTVTITPDEGKTMTINWGVSGAGGGGGGAGCVDSDGRTWWHSGGGGGAGQLIASYIKEASVPVTFEIHCGSGGRGGDSWESVGSVTGAFLTTGSGTNGSMGQSSLLYLGTGSGKTKVVDALAGHGGNGGKTTDVNPDRAAEGGSGSNAGGNGSYDYEVPGDPGGTYSVSPSDSSGRGGAGGSGQLWEIEQWNSINAHLPGGGGGAGGMYVAGMKHFANGGAGGSASMGNEASSTHKRLDTAGYGAGGGGGGGALTYYYSADDGGKAHLMPYHAGHGGAGWAYVTIFNGKINNPETDIIDGGWI